MGYGRYGVIPRRPRTENENNWAVTPLQQRLGVDVHNGRQDEGERLAGPGLGNSDHVATGHSNGPTLAGVRTA